MRKFISVLLIFFLLTSVAIPTVTAEPVPIAGAAAPAVAKLVIDGITIITTGVVVVEIAKHLGKTWDETAENWDKFAKGVSKELEKLFHAKEWIKVTSPKGQAAMRTVYECWNAGGSDGKKDNDKWYFEARIHDRQIEINPKALNEEQAVREMGRGKNIMTISERHAKDAVGRYLGKNPDDVKIESAHKTRDGYFDHANYNAHDMRLHCWIWRKA